MTATWDVAVAGAGPAGAGTAYLLARRGFRVVLLDRQHFPRPKACAEYLSPGVRDVLSNMGLENRVLKGARELHGMDVIAPSGATLRIGYSRDGWQEMAASLPRQAFDEALVNAALDAGACLQEGFVVQAPVLEDGRVCGVQGMSAGRPSTVRATLTVAADGNRSTLGRALGLTRPARWPVRMGLVAHVERARLEGGFGQMHVAPRGYCGIAPLPNGCFNVAMVVPLSALKRSGLTPARFFDSWIARNPRLHELLSGTRLASPVRGIAPVGARAVRASAPGALLVGDAAGFFDPFTGEGIYRALRGAELAAEVAEHVLRSAEKVCEADYDELRAKEFRKKSIVTTLVQLFLQHPSLLDYAISRLQERQGSLKTLGNVLGDIRPADDFLRPPALWAALRP